MSATPVERLNAALEGRYEIERELGEGGMATVYLARDLKHNRNVALKVLKPELAAVIGAERFLAEIETTANLQHPHILPLFDSGEADSALFYVMPYVDGETLRERLDREHQLPVGDAIRIATDVAEALDYAHAQGVIHRDIKPANILLQTGNPVISDFGIALAVREAGGRRLTETGLSLGTPHYMSPEQATGDQQVGPATDVYALACVLYEMLVGEPPHTGGTPQAILGKIIAGEVAPASEQRKSVPLNVDAAIVVALEKVPADRFHSAADFAAALEAIEYRLPAAAYPRSAHSSRLVRGLALALAVVGSLALWAWMRPSTSLIGPTAVLRTVIPVPVGQQLSVLRSGALPFALSPDGSLLVYAGVREGRTSLFLRPLDSFESIELSGTDGAQQPFFSWDGEQIGFFANRRLHRVPVDGGAPFRVADVPGAPHGASWGPNDTIVFSVGTDLPSAGDVFVTGTKLLKVPVAGGEPVPVELQFDVPDESEVRLPSVTWPHHLPDEAHVLVTVSGSGTVVASLASGELTPAVDGGQGQYLPGGPAGGGYIVYREAGERVRAIAFDLAALRVSGDPVPVVENVFRGAQDGGSFIRISRSGSAVYVAGGFERELVLVERSGREVQLTEERMGYRIPRFSPDGMKVSVGVDPRPTTLWMFDVASGVGSPLGGGLVSIWNPVNGRFYAGQSVLVQRWPITASPDTAMRWPVSPIFSRSWSQDGRTLIAIAPGADTGNDVWHTQLGAGGVPDTLMATPYEERDARISPEGNWLAFESDLSGAPAVYLTTYPELTGRELVSPGGGHSPLWASDGSEIYYRSGDRVMSVPVSLGSTTSVGEPVVLFRGNFDSSQPANWDVDALDRFVMVRPAPGTFGQFQFVSDLTVELAAQVGPR